MGNFLSSLFIDPLVDGLFWGTGALLHKLIRPGGQIGETDAALLGIAFWLVMVGALVGGYLLLV